MAFKLLFCLCEKRLRAEAIANKKSGLYWYNLYLVGTKTLTGHYEGGHSLTVAILFNSYRINIT